MTQNTNKKNIIVAILTDWSEAFTSEDGSFYCGTQEEDKLRTNEIINISDLVIAATDLHPLNAPEFVTNGGLFPVHDLVLPEQYDKDFVYAITPEGVELRLGDKTVSPQLTETIYDAVKDRKGSIIVPRGVYFQGGNVTPFCTPDDIEKTFDERIISVDEFIEGDFDYIVAPKQYFDATRLDSDIVMPDSKHQGIPDVNYNVFDLLEKKYPGDEYEITLINTGVVEGICRLHTSSGLRQMFPRSRMINIADATTALYGIGLGYETAEQSRDACERVGKDIGIEYMTTKKCVEEFRK